MSNATDELKFVIVVCVEDMVAAREELLFVMLDPTLSNLDATDELKFTAVLLVLVILAAKDALF
jgi:hypothetical protein